ncbi:MAG: hypothetical protein ACKOW5_14975, partial [Actinomycetales bacterium]
LGRVFAIFDMFVNVCLVTGITIMAFTAPASGRAPVAYIVAGVGLIAAASWYLRQVGRRVPSIDREGQR